MGVTGLFHETFWDMHVRWECSAKMVKCPNLPAQLGATTYAPEVTKNVTGLAKGYVDILSAREITDIVEKHS